MTRSFSNLRSQPRKKILVQNVIYFLLRVSYLCRLLQFETMGYGGTFPSNKRKTTRLSKRLSSPRLKLLPCLRFFFLRKNGSSFFLYSSHINGLREGLKDRLSERTHRVQDGKLYCYKYWLS